MKIGKDGTRVLGMFIAVVLLALLGWWFMQDAGMTFPGIPGVTEQDTNDTAGGTASSGTVASVVANAMYGGRFNQLLSQSGVLSSISGKGPYTVFVATDGAFSRLVSGTINNMSAAELKRTMQYHIVSGKSLDIDAINNSQIQALSRDTLNFKVDGGAAYVNSGMVVKSYKAKNGMVYVINAVLLPPKQ